MLKKAGIAVTVESGAGDASGFLDDDYREAGAEVAGDARAAYGAADLLLKMLSN